jgi:hypothetical protein
MVALLVAHNLYPVAVAVRVHLGLLALLQVQAMAV